MDIILASHENMMNSGTKAGIRIAAAGVAYLLSK